MQKNTGHRAKPKVYTPEERIEKRARQAARAIARSESVTMPNVARIAKAGAAGQAIVEQVLDGKLREVVLGVMPKTEEAAA